MAPQQEKLVRMELSRIQQGVGQVQHLNKVVITVTRRIWGVITGMAPSLSVVGMEIIMGYSLVSTAVFSTNA
jgi:hypothetical protein